MENDVRELARLIEELADILQPWYSSHRQQFITIAIKAHAILERYPERTADSASEQLGGNQSK